MLSSQRIVDLPTAAFYSSSTKKQELVKCEHCNILGYTKENSFRLVGYPPGQSPQTKGSKSTHSSKVAAQSSFEKSIPLPITSHEDVRVNNTLPRNFTDAQHQQILKLLDQNSIHEVSANLAGNFTSLMTVNDTNEWILDSGANAHITGSLSGYKTRNHVTPLLDL